MKQPKKQSKMKLLKFKLLLFILILNTFSSCVKEDDGIYFNEVMQLKDDYSKNELVLLNLTSNSIFSRSLDITSGEDRVY